MTNHEILRRALEQDLNDYVPGGRYEDLVNAAVDEYSDEDPIALAILATQIGWEIGKNEL